MLASPISRNQPALPHKIAYTIYNRTGVLGSASASEHHRHDFAVQPTGSGTRGQVRNQDPANRNQAESGLPFLKKTRAPHLQEGLWGVEYHTPEDPFKRLDKPTFDTSGSRLNPVESTSINSRGNGQGIRDRPVMLQDGEADDLEPNPASFLAAALVGGGADLSKPTDLANRAWYDVEDNCFVDDSLHPLPLLPQRGSPSAAIQVQPSSHQHSPKPSEGRIKLHDRVQDLRDTSAEKDSLVDGIDGKPSATSLLSSISKRTLDDDQQLLDDNPTGSREPRAPGNHDESTTLDDDDLEHDDNNPDPQHSRCIGDNGQPGSNTFNLERAPMLSNRTASKHADSGDSIDDNKFPPASKRQRLDSLSSESLPSIRQHTTTSRRPHSKDGGVSKRSLNQSDPSELGEDDNWAERRKFSAPLVGSTAFDCSNKRSAPAPSRGEGDGGDKRTENISAEDNLDSTTGGAPASELAPQMESKPCAQAICTDQVWEVRKIIGKEVVNGVLHYWVRWAETLEPGHSLGDAKEMVDKFEARLSQSVRLRRGRRDWVRTRASTWS